MIKNNHEIEVKNRHGSADELPDGFNSWEDYWNKYMADHNPDKPKLEDCKCQICKIADAEVGGHVKKTGSSMKSYIVPLCRPCNSANSDEPFKVPASLMAPVNS